MDRRAPNINKAWKKKVHWETTIGQREIVVQRFLHEQKLVVPFTQASEIDCRAYSILLERAIVDFGADVSFGQAVEKLRTSEILTWTDLLTNKKTMI